LCNDYYGYLAKKRTAGESVNEFEEVVYLLVNILLITEMEGFIDLFYQAFSLRQCRVVARSLDELGLDKLAALFTEALNIYLNGRSNISEEEFKAINPFEMRQECGQRFDEISMQILAPDSEIYLLEEPHCQFLRANKERLKESA
jgi:hypothetical protein